MKITKSSLWSEPKIIFTILTRPFELDVTAIFSNQIIYKVYNKKELASFLGIKKHQSFLELKSVFTYKKFRNKGYADKLISEAIKENKELYLICKKSLIRFYEKKDLDLLKQNIFLFFGEH